MGIKKNAPDYIRFLFYLVVIVLVNVAGTTLFFRWDLTRNRVYSLSEASRKVVATLSEPLTINVFFTRDLPAPYNNTEQYLRDLLEEYAVYGNRYFNYRFYDVSPEEGAVDREETRKNRELARTYGIHPVQIQDIEKDEVKFRNAYMGLVLIHGDLIERIPTLTSTEGLEYRLTTAIQKLNHKVSALLRLPGKVQVKLFLSSSLERVAPLMHLDGLSRLPEKIREMVAGLNKKTYGKLEFQFLDPTRTPALSVAVKKYHVLKLKWPAVSGKGIPAGEGAIGLVMEYGDRVSEIPLIRMVRIPLIGTHYELADMEKMEAVIDKNLESLIDINQDLGWLSDHGALNLSRAFSDPRRQREGEALANLRRLVSETYSIKDIRLKEDGIPEDLNCLVIARPTETFTDDELFQIDQFLMRGKSLMLFPDALREVPGFGMGGGGRYEPVRTGLEKLLSHYGIRVKPSFVMDETCYQQEMPRDMGGGRRPVYYIPIIKNRFIRHDLDFMKNIKGLAALKISPLVLDRKKLDANNLVAHELFSSSGRAWETRGRINLNPMFMPPLPPRDQRKTFPLAYVIEGKFPSYFKGKPVPVKKAPRKGEKPGDKKKEVRKKTDEVLSRISPEGEVLTRGRPGKIFIMAASAMLGDNVIDRKGKGPNAVFILNALDYLNNREGIALMRGKGQSYNPLYQTDGGVRTFVKSFNIACLPVLVVLAGLGVMFRRRSRKKRIRAMFQSAHPAREGGTP